MLAASVLDPAAKAQVLAPDGTELPGYLRSLAHLPALYTLAPGSTGRAAKARALPAALGCAQV